MSDKLKVYLETSFWSFLNGHPTPLQHIAIKQAATLQWWQEIAPNAMCSFLHMLQMRLKSGIQNVHQCESKAWLGVHH